tara:strand:- start:1551 stop:2696 length:1146 start_codon:yes stop_codon:yes gene_type:complete
MREVNKMWWNIIKSDVDFKLGMPEDGALGYWNSKNNKIVVNLNSIRYHAKKLNPKMTITDRHLVNNITNVVNHEAMHEALDESIKDIINDIARDNFMVNEGKVPFDFFKMVAEESFNELLHEWAVRLLEGKKTENIIIDLSKYVKSTTNNIREEMEKVREYTPDKTFDKHANNYNIIIFNMVERMNESIKKLNYRIHSKLKFALKTMEGSGELIKGLKLDNKTLTGFRIEDTNEERPEVEDNNCIEELRGIAERVQNSTNIYHAGYQTDNWSIIEDIPEEVACKALKMIKEYNYDGSEEIEHTLGGFLISLKHIAHTRTHIFMITIKSKTSHGYQPDELPDWLKRAHPNIMYAIVKSIHRITKIKVEDEHQIDMAKYVDWR